jgi:hypothetical protein
MMVTWQQVEYQGWANCYRLANGEVELLVTTDVGPRILQFGFAGEGNELGEFAEMWGKTGGDEWRIYGGHRLWHAPEALPRTYYPDNGPVAWEQDGAVIRLRPAVEGTTGIQKEIEIALHPEKAAVRLTHRLVNRNLWPVTLAPWALTVMATGGTAVIPLPPRGTHPEDLLPTSDLTLWAYTDMSDGRWTWGERYILLRQEPGMARPQKIGAFVPDGWLAYARNGHLFVKTFGVTAGAEYPDRGSNVELFTNATMIELETLGPLALVEPGAAVEHVERWYLWRDVERPTNDADVTKHIAPILEKIGHEAGSL